MHPDISYHVDDTQGAERVFDSFNDAAGFAVEQAACRGESTLDIVIWSEDGAYAFGGDDAVERYREDPGASVFERLEIKVNNVGRVA